MVISTLQNSKLTISPNMEKKWEHLYNFAAKLGQRKMKKIFIHLLVVLSLFAEALFAQQSVEVKQKNIFEKLAIPDSVTHATVKVHQDKRVESLVVGKRYINYSHEDRIISGYRVQVFSSNIQRTAKTDAFRIEKKIKEEFPDQTVYVTYPSPFWKVRVGDFRSQSQALAFRNKLIETFPNMRSEVYIVKEQIIIPGSK